MENFRLHRSLHLQNLPVQSKAASKVGFGIRNCQSDSLPNQLATVLALLVLAQRVVETV